MTETPTFLEDPTDTRDAIMRATYLALCNHGYADLTIQRIADEFPKSKSLLYHHYDGKDDLLLDFLEFMLEQQRERIPAEPTSSADDHLNAIFKRVFRTPMTDDYRDFWRAMVELRAQAAHDEKYRDHFTRSDEFFRELFANVVRSGIDDGVFREVNPERTAAYLQTTITGVMTQRVTTNGDIIEDVREELDEYVRLRLLAGETGDSTER
ncbi:TetR/AcrR family transcriptional regulator (plasmid) [Haladaptatus sp. SPP-AMP-3]|uniref:TetR/AcrR family transcriptional regulator n=1 Tax=Haladaptatus sp. SPP-AMP-3 TaxID=3121295 RepID=UPI003C2CDBF7